MKLSIIIPVYNTEKYLKECLESVLLKIRNEQDIEVILIDDGSTDGSSKIYHSFKQSNFKYFKNENHGVSYSRNEGIKRATGKWIMFLDADDILSSNWLDILKEELESKDDIIYFFHNNQEEVSKAKLLDNIIGLNHSYPYMTFPGSRIFRRSFLEENSIFFKEDIINGEDLLFNLEALSKTKHYCIVNNSIYQYRYNLYSSTKKFHENIFVSDKKFQEELVRICNDNYIKNKKLYIDFCLKNAIFTFISRISFLEGNVYKRKLFIFEEELYHRYLEKYKLEKRISFVSMIVFLVKKKHYSLAVYLIRLRRLMNHLIFMKKKKDRLEKV